MLRDITASARINSEAGPCVWNLGEKSLQKIARQVHFTEEGLLYHHLVDLMEAMSASEAQAQRQAAMPRTPSKPTKEPRRPMIGSSSTWGKAELDRFQVDVRNANARNEMIPERWFDFSSLDEYTERILPFSFSFFIL